MGKLILFIATSLDGYIARPDGGIDWLENMYNPDQIDHGYESFIGTVETLIMGRTTYDKIRGMGIEWPYTGKRTYVLSSNDKFSPSTPETYLCSESPASLTARLKSECNGNIWLVGGGITCSSFFTGQLVDEIILTIIPVILGEGIPLFDRKLPFSSWKLIRSETFSSGAVSLHYRIQP